MLGLQVKFLSGFEDVLVPAVEFVLDLYALHVCILQQRGKPAYTLFVEFKLSHDLVSFAQRLCLVLRSAVSLDALEDWLHRDGVHLVLDLRDLFLELVILPLHIFSKSAGRLFLLQALVPLVGQLLPGNLELILFKACLLVLGLQSHDLFAKPTFDVVCVLHLLTEDLDFVVQRRIESLLIGNRELVNTLLRNHRTLDLQNVLVESKNCRLVDLAVHFSLRELLVKLLLLPSKTL